MGQPETTCSPEDHEIAAIRERAQQRRHAAYGAAFVQTFTALARKLPKPAPPKKSARKRGGDEDKGRASTRKNIKRLFAKVTRWTVADERGDELPSIDADAEHRHRQSMADPGHQQRQERPQHPGPNYPSPTL
jgi:hypothetical protein